MLSQSAEISGQTAIESRTPEVMQAPSAASIQPPSMTTAPVETAAPFVIGATAVELDRLQDDFEQEEEAPEATLEEDLKTFSLERLSASVPKHTYAARTSNNFPLKKRYTDVQSPALPSAKDYARIIAAESSLELDDINTSIPLNARPPKATVEEPRTEYPEAEPVASAQATPASRPEVIVVHHKQGAKSEAPSAVDEGVRDQIREAMQEPPQSTEQQEQSQPILERITEEELQRLMNEPLMRQLVADMISEELRGSLGTRITANLRKFIVRELKRHTISERASW